MHAVAISPRSTGDRSRPTGREATHSPGRRQGSGRKRAQDSSVGVPRLTSLLRVCARGALVPMTTKPPPMRTRGELPLRSTGRIIALAATMAAFALGPGSAFAPAQAVPPGSAVRCNTLASTANQLQTVHNNLAAAVAAVQQRIAGGNLTGRQLAAARVQLAVLSFQLRFVDLLLVRVQQTYERLCGGSAPPPQPPSSPPPPSPPPPEQGE